MQPAEENLDSPLPEPILRILDNHHRGGITPEDCVDCSSLCCGQGGFALLENVEAIFDQYTSGKLTRDDFEFQPGLSFSDFVAEYFDVYRYDVPNTTPRESIVFFFMRSLSRCGHTVSIPPMSDVHSYYKAREAFFRSNAWMKGGCVFLSQHLTNWPHTDELRSRHCILHSADSGQNLTAKPIDCVFHTCETPLTKRKPTIGQSDDWFAGLARRWPGSVGRFRQRVEADAKLSD